jgi:hypothetical protein
LAIGPLKKLRKGSIDRCMASASGVVMVGV